MRTSKTTTQLTAALLEVQFNLPIIAHDARNDYFDSNYTTLAGIFTAIKELVHENKILISQGVTYNPEASNESYRGTVFTRLTHVSGEWQEDDGVPILVEKNKKGAETPQAVGSAISYARRQGLTAMLGINTDDDDGQAASEGNNPKAKAPAEKGKAPAKSLTGPIKSLTGLKKACKDLQTDIDQVKDLDGLTALMGHKDTTKLIGQLTVDLPDAWDTPKGEKTGFMGLKQQAKKREVDLITESTRRREIFKGGAKQ